MLTRCPHCTTIFRVTPEQLKVRAGQVRCGACRGAFNALDSLADEVAVVIETERIMAPEPRQAEEVPLATTLAAEEIAVEIAEPQPPPMAEVAPPPETPIQVTPDLPPRDEPAPEPPPVAVPEPLPAAESATAAPVAPAVEPALDPAEEPQTIPEATTETSPPTETILDFEISPASAPDQDFIEAADRSGEPAPAADETAESRRPPDGTGASEGIEATEATEATDAVVPPAAKAPVRVVSEPQEVIPVAWNELPTPKPPRRWPWAVGVTTLLLLTLGQLLYAYRVELAVLLPELRPALAAGCELLECSMPLPHKPELLSIETSDLIPAENDRLLLTATLKNRAPFEQELPNLELTLTDSRDAAMVRKVLTPADYLPADQAAATGFPARAEIAVRLTLEALGVPAVGYRLYLFYP